MIIPDNTDLAISILADYHEDNHNYQLADELRQEPQGIHQWQREYKPRFARPPAADAIDGLARFSGESLGCGQAGLYPGSHIPPNGSDGGVGGQDIRLPC